MSLVRLGMTLSAAALTLHAQTAPPPPPGPPPAPAASSAAATSDTPKSRTERSHIFDKFDFGFQVRYIPLRQFDHRYIDDYFSKTNTAYTYNTTTASSRWALGPVVDWNVTDRWTIRTEAFFGHLQYSKETRYYTGGTSSSGTWKKIFTEHTKTGYWDVPVVARYQFGQEANGVNKARFLGYVLSHWFAEGGVVVRTLTGVRSGNDTLNSDNTSAYNETPALSHAITPGLVVGLGLRDVDDYKFKLIPEVRYTRWAYPTFNLESTHSRPDQLEIGFSLTR